LPSIITIRMPRSSIRWCSHRSICAVVSATKRRETLLRDVDRSFRFAGSGSSVEAYWRVLTPATIAAIVCSSRGSRSDTAWNVGSASSAPSTLRTRGRGIGIRRPPSVTSLGA